MTRPTRFLTPMLLFVATVIAVVGALHQPLLEAFMANPALNGIILLALMLGIFYLLRQVVRLGREVDWITAFNKAQSIGEVSTKPQLLAPLASMMTREQGAPRLNTSSMRSLADSVAARLDERREISRYMVGLLVFLGLLGTFWGLLGTISAIGDTIAGMSVDTSNLIKMFDSLKAGLETPLAGMGTAFSSSLFGLAGSLVLGFLDLQLGQAQNRFYTELEDWLASHTKLGSGKALEIDEHVPAYIEALMTQTADSMEAVERQNSRAERDKREISSALNQLAETIAALGDHLRSERQNLDHLVRGQQALLEALQKKPEAPGPDQALEAESLAHLRAMDVSLKRLLEIQDTAREQFSEDLHIAFRRMTKSMASMIASPQQPRNTSRQEDETDL